MKETITHEELAELKAAFPSMDGGDLIEVHIHGNFGPQDEDVIMRELRLHKGRFVSIGDNMVIAGFPTVNDCAEFEESVKWLLNASHSYITMPDPLIKGHNLATIEVEVNGHCYWYAYDLRHVEDVLRYEHRIEYLAKIGVSYVNRLSDE